MNPGRRWLRAVLVAAVFLEAVAIAGTVVYRSQNRRAMIEAGAPLPALRGYQLDFAGGLYTAPQGCIVYRVVSHLCGYCLQAEPSWQQLMRRKVAERCQFVIVLPEPQAAPYYLKATAIPIPQVVWMPLDWAGAVEFEVTPTTVVTYRGQIVWVSEGEMDARRFADLRAELARMPGG